nr:uncharacterized protein LOC129280489 [Lytechinus pictus]
MARPIPKLVYLVSAAVCFAIVISTCFICCFYGINRRRHKRRQESHQIENAAVPTDCSSRRARHEGNENIYCTVGPSLHRPVESTNITNGCTASGLNLSSEDTYDHTDSSGRIQSSRNRHQHGQGWQSLPRRLPSGSRGSQRDSSDTQKVTEASEGLKGGNRGFGCSMSKHGATGSCQGVMTLGRPWSNQRSTRANCRRGFKKWSREASTGVVNVESHIGRGTPRNALKVELAGGQLNYDVHHKGSLELSAVTYKKRGMLALPCNRDTFENTQSGRNGKYASRTDDGRRPVNPRVEKLGDSAKDMPDGSYYHTLESDHEKEIVMDKDQGEPPSSSQYFAEEPIDYSEEPSEVYDHKYLEDTATCSRYSEPQYDYAALPEQSSLRF